MDVFCFLSFLTIALGTIALALIAKNTTEAPDYPPEFDPAEDFTGLPKMIIRLWQLRFRKKTLKSIAYVYAFAGFACVMAICGDGFWRYFFDWLLQINRPNRPVDNPH